MGDVRITRSLPRTSIERWDANMRALRIAKDLEATGREATPEEQRHLASFSGFGDSAFEDAFRAAGARDAAWERRRKDLQDVVGEENFRDLSRLERSRRNAHYTTEPVIRAMWQGLQSMGADKLERPRILEPSAGSGRFLGLQPEDMANRSERHAVELDNLTALVLKHAYPDTTVHNIGYQQAPVPDNYYDIAISNVPFADSGVTDGTFIRSGRKYLTNRIHNYFFAKTLDKLRPGGVMAFITSHHTLDADRAEPVRRYLADRADLLGAMRLPKGTFPDTDVVTDVVYLRKREDGEQPGDDSWVKTSKIDVRVQSRYGGWRDVPVAINSYYEDNPDKVLGKHALTRGMYTEDEYTVEAEDGQDTGEVLQRATQQMARAAGPQAIRPARERPADGARAAAVDTAGYALDAQGRLRSRDAQGVLNDHALDAQSNRRVTDLVRMRDQTRALVNRELAGETDDALEDARVALRDNYMAYVNRTGEALNTPENQNLMQGTADDTLLFALENYDVENECWTPSEILYQRAIGRAPAPSIETPHDALADSLNTTGTVDLERMGAELGRDPEAVRDALETDGAIIRTPEGAYVTREEYLSGNVREKLKVAQAAAKTQPAFRAHVEALEAVQPEWATASEIKAPIGAHWIPPEVINGFINEVMLRNSRYRYARSDTGWVGYVSSAEGGIGVGKAGGGGWHLRTNLPRYGAEEWGSPGRSADKILMAALTNREITVTTDKKVDAEATAAARAKTAELRQAFQEWVWADPERQALLEEQFNETQNNYTNREYTGQHLTFPGMSARWQKQMLPHQRSAVERGVNEGTVLLAHEVGFGKTATMAAIAEKRKQLGAAQKPMFVVPKPIYQQFAKEYLSVYPGAKILVPTQEDFQKGNRQRFLARVATGDWDGVILSTEQFKSIPLNPKFEMEQSRLQVDQLTESLNAVSSATGDHTSKQVSGLIDKYEKRIGDLRVEIDAGRDGQTVYFDDLGIDSLHVDEADRYKNLTYVTSMGEDIKGMPNTQAQRSWDMLMKIRWLQEKYGEREPGKPAKGGVVFATGTPISNSMTEIYTMMRYLMPERLEEQGIRAFDDWASSYGLAEQGYEYRADGSFKPTIRFGTRNNKYLQRLMQQVTDTRIASETPHMLAKQPRILGDDGEDGKRIAVVSSRTPALQEYMKIIARRAEALKDHKDPKRDNMLLIATDARKAALDIRMLDPDAVQHRHIPRQAMETLLTQQEPEDSKLNNVVANVSRIYREEEADRGTQLVFLDWGTPTAKRETAKDDDDDSDEGSAGDLDERDTGVVRNLYGVIKEKLIAKGVPEEEIAFIHEADDANADRAKEKRGALIDAVNSGEIRVLIGSTEKAGVGLNVQKRAAALHHIDAPWRPRDIEQREGRIIRQGNEVYGPELDEDGVPVAPGRGVRVYQYLQEGSFDRNMWQGVGKKSANIKKLLKREALSSNDDVGAMDEFTFSANEAMALASGDTRALRLAQLNQMTEQMGVEQAGHRRTMDDAKTRAGHLASNNRQMEAILPALERDAARVAAAPAEKKFAVTLRGMDFDKRDLAGERLETLLKGIKIDEEAPLGQLQGFELVGGHDARGFQISIKSPGTGQQYASGWVDRGELTGVGMLTRAQNLIKGLPERLKAVQQKLGENREATAGFEQRATGQWKGAAQLQHLRDARDVVRYLMTAEKGGSMNATEEQEFQRLGASLAARGIDPSGYDFESDEPPSGAAVRQEPTPVPRLEAAPGLSSTAPVADTSPSDEEDDDEYDYEDDAYLDVDGTLIPDPRPSIADGPNATPSAQDSGDDLNLLRERVQQLAGLRSTRMTNRLAGRADDMDAEEAQEAIDDLVDLYESDDALRDDVDRIMRPPTREAVTVDGDPPAAVREAERVAHDAEDFQNALDRYEGADAALDIIGEGDREKGRERVHERYKEELAQVREEATENVAYVEAVEDALKSDSQRRQEENERIRTRQLVGMVEKEDQVRANLAAMDDDTIRANIKSLRDTLAAFQGNQSVEDPVLTAIERYERELADRTAEQASEPTASVGMFAREHRREEPTPTVASDRWDLDALERIYTGRTDDDLHELKRHGNETLEAGFVRGRERRELLNKLEGIDVELSRRRAAPKAGPQEPVQDEPADAEESPDTIRDAKGFSIPDHEDRLEALQIGLRNARERGGGNREEIYRTEQNIAETMDDQEQLQARRERNQQIAAGQRMLGDAPVREAEPDDSPAPTDDDTLSASAADADSAGSAEAPIGQVPPSDVSALPKPPAPPKPKRERKPRGERQRKSPAEAGVDPLPIPDFAVPAEEAPAPAERAKSSPAAAGLNRRVKTILDTARQAQRYGDKAFIRDAIKEIDQRLRATPGAALSPENAQRLANLRGEKAPLQRVSPAPVPLHVRQKAMNDLAKQHASAMATVPLTQDEKAQVKQLFDAERAAVKSGADRSPFQRERQAILDAAKKRGRKKPSEHARSIAHRMRKEEELRRAGRGAGRTREKDLRTSPTFTMPTIQVRTR